MACRKPSTTSCCDAPLAGGSGSTCTPVFTPAACGVWCSTGPLVGTVAQPVRARTSATGAASQLIERKLRHLLQVGGHHGPRRTVQGLPGTTRDGEPELRAETGTAPGGEPPAVQARVLEGDRQAEPGAAHA